MIFNMQDVLYVWMLRKHKHDYRRIENGKTCGIPWQRHQCIFCKKIVGLDEWQMRRLPADMLYEKLKVKEAESEIKN